MSSHGVALGVDEDDPAAGVGVGEDLPGDQRGLAGAGRAADPQVVAGVGDRQADRAGRPGVGNAEGADAGAGERDGGRRRDGACPGAGQARQRRVGGQPGDRREFRHGQQVALGQPPGADRGGGAAQPAAGEPVPPGEQGGGRGEGVGQAAQPGRLLRGGGPPFPAACAVAGLDRGGGGDARSGSGFPTAARRAWRWSRGSRRPGRDRRGRRPGCGWCRARGWPGPAAGRRAGRTARTAACGRRGGPCGAGLR